MTESYPLYGGSVELVFDTERHIYRANGEIMYGVTSILDVISKPALVAWAAKMAAEYIQTNLKPGVMLDEIQIKELADNAKSAHRQKRDKAADIGTLVHNSIEEYIKHRTMPKIINPEAEKGFNAFLEWAHLNDVTFDQSELKVYSKQHGFAGTADLLVTIGGEKYLGDIKTGSGIYETMKLQTAAYELARTEEYPDENYAGNIIINCRKDGTLETATYLKPEVEEAKKAFLSANELFRWVKKQSK